MRSVKSLLLLVIFAVLMSGCGVSGSLYLPDGSESIKPDAPDDIDQQIDATKDQQSLST